MGIPSRHPEHEEEEEYDDAQFYEGIQAPMFVDLTAPDAGRPTDDASWFCLRVGCDQNHQQVDPEALDRSFFMRVMAARSPNVRLHKAINRFNQSSMLKCPHSAPPKPPKARFARLTAATEAAKKAAPRPRPRVQRAFVARASPTRTKAVRIEPSSARKKALTTPRSKVVRPRQDPFLSAKHQKQPVAAAERKGTVVKALFMSTPRKEAARMPVPDKGLETVTEVCSKLRKLNLACREVSSRYMLPTTTTAKKGEETTAAAKSAKNVQESRTNGKKKILGRSVKCANAEADGRSRNGCDNSAVDENSHTETASLNRQRKAVLQEVGIEAGTLRTDNSDDNKENCVDNADQPTEVASNYSSHHEGGRTLLENNENVPLKVPSMQSKLKQDQGGKLKTTNPKPFRLRTDERRVLKDANPERKQPFAENNSMAVLKPMNKCPAAKGRDKPICSEKQKKQATRTAMGELGEAKQTLNSIRCKSTRTAAMAKGRLSRNHRVPRVASTGARVQADIEQPRQQVSQTGKERKPSVKTSRLQAAAA